MKANKESQPRNELDADFGLVPQKPVYTVGIDEQEKYLKSLLTINGEPIKWNRRGSMSVNGVHGMIDVYDIYLMSGAEYKTIYEEARSLSAGEVGDIIETADAFYIPLRLQKPSDYLNTANGMTEIVNLYIEHSLYSTLDSQNETLAISYTSAFSRYADAFGSNIK